MKQLYTTHRKVKNKNDIKWDEKYHLLCEYKEEFGNCNVPSNFIYKGVTLGAWCRSQRLALKGKRRSALNKEKIDRLNSIGFIWDSHEYNWNLNFNLLCEYKDEFGNCNVPDSLIYKGYSLGRWCSVQRQTYKGKGTSVLNKNQIDKLNAIGFVWDVFQDQWDFMFDLLCDYKYEFDNCNVPHSFIYKGYNLGRWCANQRQSLKGNIRNNLTKERIDKLNGIGFLWKIK